MEYEEFIAKVQQYAGLASKDEALRVTEASLETLGERLSRVHRQHLSAQLPGKLKEAVLRRKRTRLFPLEEYYRRVSARAGISYHQAMKSARAVMCVLQEQVAAGELRDIAAELVDGWQELFVSQKAEPIPPFAVDTHELFRK